MRGWLVTFLLAGMLATFVYLVVSRPREPHAMPRPDAPAHDADAEAPDAPLADGNGTATAAGADAMTVGDAGPADPGRRPVRVVAASWELVAAVVLANGGLSTGDRSVMRAAGLEVRVDAVPTGRDVENRLARGGADPEGADIAVVPLPALVASYERLRALEPQIVHLVGWSRGREVLLGAREGMLVRSHAAPAAVAEEASLYSNDVAASAVALFAIEEAGTRASRVRITDDPRGASFAALARPLPSDRAADAPARPLLTTADASRLVPLVAVAARSFAEGHLAEVAALLRGWLAGAESLRADVPAAARRIASENGAPEPAAMIERLGWMEATSGAEDARALGLVGHDLVNVAALFSRNWQSFRDTGILLSPAPPAAPIAAAALAQALAAMPDAGAPAGPSARPSEVDTRVLLASRLERADAEAVATHAAWLAAVFERSTVRVSARPASLAKEAVRSATERFGIASDRWIVATTPLAAGAGAALMEVLATP